jgi:hypothetical protein
MADRFEVLEIPGAIGTKTPSLFCVIDTRDDDRTMFADNDPEKVRRACIIRNQPLSGRAKALLAKLEAPGAFLTFKKVPAAAQELVDKARANLVPHHNGESKLTLRGTPIPSSV